MANAIAAEPQLSRVGAEQLVSYGFGITATPPTDAAIKAAGEQHRAGNYEAALKMIKGDLLPYSEQDVKKSLINHLSTDRGPDGRKVSPTDVNERRRYTESESVAQDVRKFVEQNVVTPQFRAMLRSSLVSNCPAIRDIVMNSGTPTTAIDAIVDTMINDPAFKDGLLQLNNPRLDPNKKLTQEDAVRTAQSQLDELKSQLQAEVTPAQIKAAQDAVDAVNLKLATLAPKMLDLQSKAERYQELNDNLPSYKKEIAKLLPSVQPMLNDINTFKASLVGLDPVADAAQIAKINSDIKIIESKPEYKKYMGLESLLAERVQLAKEIADIQKDVTPPQQELERAKQYLKDLQEKQKTAITPQKKAEIESKIKQKEIELADAKDQLEAEMIKFARDITHMPQDAAEAYINAVFGKLKNSYIEEAKKITEKEASDETSLAEIGINKIPNLWKKEVTEKGKPIKVPDKNKALDFLEDVFKPGAQENIAVKLDNMTDTQLTSLGLSAQEIKAFRAKMKNPEFRKTQADSLAKQALTDYFLDGGRMSQNMVIAMTTSEWGKTLLDQGRAKANEIIANAKGQLNKNVLGRVDEMKQQLDQAKNSSADFIKNNWWKIGIAILILLMILGMKGMAGV